MQNIRLYCLIVTLSLLLLGNIGCKNSKTPGLESLLTHETCVLLFLNTECPICKKYQGSFKKLNKKYNASCEFIYIFPNNDDSADVEQFCAFDSISKKHIVLDPNLQYTKLANATITPQAVIINKNKIVYSGKIDDRFLTLGSEKPASVNYIEKVLISLLNNETIEIKENNPVGCLIEQ